MSGKALLVVWSVLDSRWSFVPLSYLIPPQKFRKKESRVSQVLFQSFSL